MIFGHVPATAVSPPSIAMFDRLPNLSIVEREDLTADLLQGFHHDKATFLEKGWGLRLFRPTTPQTLK